MNHIPTSMYYPGDSALHKLNPVFKMVCFILLIIAVILSGNVIEYCIIIGLTLFLMILSRIPFPHILSSVKRFYLFYIVIIAMNTCFYGQGTPWVSFGFFKPSYAGLMQGINVATHVAILLVIANLLVLTTPPLSLTASIEALLSPFRLVRLPVDQIAMILSVAVQFIPTLFEETDAIRTAQTARGARFDSPKLFEKGKAVLPLFIPIFISAFKRADELSLAMEARGYRVNHKRRRKRRYTTRSPDIIAAIICASICLIFIFIF